MPFDLMIGVFVEAIACVAGAAAVVAATAAAVAAMIANVAVAGVRVTAVAVFAVVGWLEIPSKFVVVNLDLIAKKGEGLMLWNLHQRGLEKKQKMSTFYHRSQDSYRMVNGKNVASPLLVRHRVLKSLLFVSVSRRKEVSDLAIAVADAAESATSAYVDEFAVPSGRVPAFD